MPTTEHHPDSDIPDADYVVDLHVFGRTRRTQLSDLSVGVTTSNDFGFTAADTAMT
jgi:hypothetical protein